MVNHSPHLNVINHSPFLTVLNDSLILNALNGSPHLIFTRQLNVYQMRLLYLDLTDSELFTAYIKPVNDSPSS